MKRLGTCTLCEAACGVVLEVEHDRVISVRGDPDDPMSRGFVCPKVVGMQEIHEDPDRLRRPLVRERGRLREASWDDAMARAATGLRRVRRRHGRDALGVYQGNPTAHNLSLLTLGQLVLRTLRTKNLYSASTADQIPHMRAAHEMFGHLVLMPVPDIDRTDFWLVVGANPMVSNGSIMTAPNVPRRIDALKARGGKLVVVDPRRTETAARADRHLFLRPGADALFFAAMIHVVFEESLTRGASGPHLAGVAELRDACRAFAPERVAARTGIAADDLRRLARDFARAKSAAPYARLGTCHQEHATLASWLAYALAAVTGNLDRPGGLMWTTPAVDFVVVADRFGLAGLGRYASRVRGLPEIGGELPVAALAEEIEAGHVRALLTSAGNPVLSAPNGARVDRALAKLDFMVSVDPYLNETTRHADVVLPPCSPLARPHYDVALNAFAVRNVAKWVDAPLPRASGERDDGDILFELGLRLRLGRAGGVVARRARHAVTAERLVDLGLRAGPHRLSVAKLRAQPHGIDLGVLEPRLPGILRNADRRVQLAPEACLRELPALRATLDEAPPELVIVGRRHLRSNNSWLHNARLLVKGPPRCTLLVHPTDAAARGLVHGARARVATARGAVVAIVEITDAIMPGVVSLPHGWGHDREGVRLEVARAHAGVSLNDLTDDRRVDRLSGNAALSGVPVTLEAAQGQ
jgi:anaerobic selenocysteine-containing dehydrogenase